MMSGLIYVEEETYIVRESLINFRVTQKVRKREEDRVWTIGAVIDKQIKVFDGDEVRWYHYSELETLDLGKSTLENYKSKWSKKEVAELISNIHKPLRVLAEMLKRTESSIGAKIYRLRDEHVI